MIIKGRFNEAVVFTDTLDETSRAQIERMLDNPVFKDRKIRIMPDVHAGAGCVIGLSMDMGSTVVPNLVGVDIGCGVLTTRLKERTFDMSSLDRVIRERVPSGFSVHRTASRHQKAHAESLGIERIKAETDLERAVLSIGTLGGGNHFIEVGRSSEGELHLFVHTGSRRFGYDIARHHQNVAIRSSGTAQGEKDLAHLEGAAMQAYLHDMRIAQDYAATNRRVITETLLEHARLTALEMFDTVHNTIDRRDSIIRKGAVPARKGERLVIPLNMRDGVILAEGKGNEAWNETAPHGAGRLYSRGEARRRFKLEDFKKSMAHIHSTSVTKRTLDEAPMAYKAADAIISHTKDTIDILGIVEPIYNFKG